MKIRKITYSVFIIFMLILFAAPQGSAQPSPRGKAPVITNAYLIGQGRYGDVLKIYIEADDPDGEMLRVATTVDQVAYGLYPTDWIYLKPQYRRHFVGYLQWNTYSSHTGYIREWTWITVKVSVFDKAGNESNVVALPFQFLSEVVKNSRPPAPFDQGNLPRLGHVGINLYEPTQMGDGKDIP